MNDISKFSQLQRALFTIKKLKQELRNQTPSEQPIAIIGLSCRFPNAINKAAFWDLLRQTQNAITHYPEQRLALLKGTREYNTYQPDYPYWGGYISEIEQFDAQFFGITPREALLMDPQQRLLLEVAYEALEDAGLPIEQIAGSNTGVFVGMYASEFSGLQSIESDMDALYLPTGNASSIAANRLSYQFDLHGPSMTIDTACSTSLVAINLACAAIRNKQCDIALVGGAKINLLPSTNVILSQAKMLSPDGQCKTFDAGANGYVQGEGIGMVILKPLANALRDNDRIYSVILGSAVNQDGKSNGLTAPNGAQQEQLLRAAYAASKIDPAQVSYIECHGTGTALGDPIEVEALEQVIGTRHTHEQPCWLGSVKTNIGHLEPAAGIAGIIKVALALQAGKLPAHGNFVAPNPLIPFDRFHFQIPQQYQDWPVYGDYRVAGVSSFGFGGTNAHVVLRETYGVEKSQPVSTSLSPQPELFTLAAKNRTALHLLISRWSEFLEHNDTLDLAQICYNLHLRRSHYPCRLALIVRSITELQSVLMQLKQDINFTDVTVFKSTKQTSANAAPESEDDLTNLANTYINHGNINWSQYESTRQYPLLDMPSYPWQHKVFWPEFSSVPQSEEDTQDYPLQGRQVSISKHEAHFEFTLDLLKIPELEDTYQVAHIGFYLEMLAYASQQISGQQSFEIRNLDLGNILYVPQDRPLSIQLVFKIMPENQAQFKLYSMDAKKKQSVEHAHGTVLWPAIAVHTMKTPVGLQQQFGLVHEGTGDEFVTRIKAMDMPISGSIRWTEKFWDNNNMLLSQFRRIETNSNAQLFTMNLHPGIFDACIQTLFLLLDKSVEQPYLTTKIRSFKYFGERSQDLYVRAERTSSAIQAKLLSGNWDLFANDGRLIASCESVQLTQLGRKRSAKENGNLFSSMVKQLNVNELPAAQRYEQIIDFLCEQVAFIFKMPSKDVALDRPLTDMGMDSLMTMALAKKINEGMNLNLSLQELLQPISIQEITDKILIELKAETSKVNNLYVPYCQRRPSSKMRLFCFPFGGGGASVYRSWYESFPDDIEVCPVQLPGRENLEAIPPISDLNTLIATLYDNLSSEFDLPFAFYGHSFGSLIAFELTRYLKQHRLKEPMHLFVSASPAPHSRNPLKFQQLIQHLNDLPYDIWHTPAQDITSHQIKHIMKLFKFAMPDMDYNSYDTQFIRPLIPYFLADILIVANYNIPSQTTLELPITAFYGKYDTFVTEHSISEWNLYTSNTFNIEAINGKHLFIKEQQGKSETIMAIIKQIVRTGE